MAKVDLSQYGITGTTEVVYNPSYEDLFAEETKPELEGYEKGQVTELVLLMSELVSTPDVLLRISSSLWMRTLRTQYGGPLTSIRTIIIRQAKKHGQQ